MVPKPTSAFTVLLVICTLALGAVVPGTTTQVYAAQEDAALFQDALSGLGQWLNYDQHGPVWRPRQVDRNWRPYTNGRWVPTQEGYVFETDEPWGWATYHYGNWQPTKEHGWVWVPGRTWYPHTVNWRTSDENVGWAPVPPPEYTGSNTADNYYSENYPSGGYSSTTDMSSYGTAPSRILPSSLDLYPGFGFSSGLGPTLRADVFVCLLRSAGCTPIHPDHVSTHRVRQQLCLPKLCPQGLLQLGAAGDLYHQSDEY